MQHMVAVLVNAEEYQLADFVLPDFERRAAVNCQGPLSLRIRRERAPLLRSTEMKVVEAMIGTWRVVEIADLDRDGKWQYRFGEHPRGYFVYDVTGHVHIQIMKVPAPPPFPEANLTDGKPPSPEHALAAYTAYV